MLGNNDISNISYTDNDANINFMFTFNCLILKHCSIISLLYILSLMIVYTPQK